MSVPTDCVKQFGSSFYALDGVVSDDTQTFSNKRQEWEDYYNYHRLHGGLGGQTPYERLRQKTQPGRRR